MSEISFFVAGLPQTQAGMRDVPTKNGGRALITTGGKDLKPWRKKVKQVAELAKRNTPTLTGPVEVTYRFVLPMPSTRPVALRRQGIDWSYSKPDLDKLARAIGDSLSDAAVYGDDGQIARSVIAKVVVHDRSLCGVEVVVRQIPDTDDTRAYLLALLERRRSMLRG